MDSNTSSQFPTSPHGAISARRGRCSRRCKPEYALWIDEGSGAVSLGDGNYRAAAPAGAPVWDDFFRQD